MTACGLDVKVGKPYMRAVIETPWSSLTLFFPMQSYTLRSAHSSTYTNPHTGLVL